MRTLTPAEREQCNLTVINCRFKWKPGAGVSTLSTYNDYSYKRQGAMVGWHQVIAKLQNLDHDSD